MRTGVVTIACGLILGGCGRSGFQEYVDGAPSNPPDDGLIGDGSRPIDATGAIKMDAAVDALPAATGSTDTYLRGSSSPTSYGTATELRVGRDTGGNNDATLVWFDLTGHPAVAVTGAKLRLYQFAASGSGTIVMDANRLTQTWDEATATWFDASQNPTVTWTGTGGGAYASTVYTSTSVPLGTFAYYDWDITTMVNEWLLGTYPNDGVELTYQTQPSISTYAQFASREYGTTAFRPQLIITP